MQTFLPYPDFRRSAGVLDDRRLGKQRVEALQILRALKGRSRGWRNHPAVKMWRGCATALAIYGVCVCEEWIKRGFRDRCLAKLRRFVRNAIGDSTVFQWPSDGKMTILSTIFSVATPTWLGRKDFHASHRSNLLRKDPDHYGQFGWREPPTLPYVWPEVAA